MDAHEKDQEKNVTDPPRVTRADPKKKSPGRVEWGRKLAELSKQHRAEKKRMPAGTTETESIAPAEKKRMPVGTTETESNAQSISPQVWIGLAGLLLGLGALYYQSRAVSVVPPASAKCATAPVVPVESTPQNRLASMK